MKTTSKTTLLFVTTILGIWVINFFVHYFWFDLINKSDHYVYELFTSIIVTIVLVLLLGIINYVLIKKEKYTKIIKYNEERLEEIIENTNEWIWELDKDGLFIYSSKMASEILGYEDKELVNKFYYYDLFTPKYRKIAKGVFDRQRKFIDIVSENISKNGKSVWLKHTGIPFFNDQKEFIGYRGISKDFSAQKQAKDTLDSLSKTFSAFSGEEFMLKMCEHISETLLVKYVYVGEVSSDLSKVNIITGIGNSEKIIPFEYKLENSPSKNVAGKKLSSYTEKVAELFPNDKFISEMKIESYLGAPIFDREGNSTGILVLMDTEPFDNSERAISLFNIFLERTSAEIERLQSQRALAKSEETFRNIFNNSPIGMFQSSIDLEYIYNCNSRFCELVGYSLYELTKLSPDQLWINDDQRVAMINMVLSDKDIKSFETELLTKKGDLIFVNISFTVYKESGYIESTVIDITDTKLIEDTRKAILNLNSDSIDFSIEQIFASGLGKIREITKSDSVFYYLIDQSEVELPKFIALNNKMGVTSSENQIPNILDNNILEECLNEKKTFIKNYEETIANGIVRMLYIPIIENDKVISIFGMKEKQYNYSILEADQIKLLAEDIWSLANKKRVEQKLIVNESNFRTFFDSVDSLVFIVNLDEEILEINNTVLNKLRYKRENLIGKRISDFHQMLRREEVKTFFNLAKKGEVVFSNIPLLSKGHSEIEVETTFNLGLWNDKKAVIVVYKDVSLLRQSEQLLEKNKKNLQTFFDTVDNLLFVLDNVGNIISVNMSGLKRLGYTEEEIIGQNLLSLYSPSQKREAIQFITGMIEGKKENCTLPFVAKDGAIIPVETKVKSGIWDGQKVLFGVANDLSLLKESEEKFSTAFHNSSVIMAINSAATGEFFDINNTFTEILGYTREEVLGKTVKDLGLLVNNDSLVKLNNVLLEKGIIRNYVQEFYTKDKEIKIGSVSINIVSLQGELFELVAINDITELKEKEFKLAESELNLKKAQTISKLGSWEWDLSTDQIVCSEEAYHIFGLDTTIKPNIQMVVDLIYREDHTIFTEALKLARSGSPLTSIEVRIQTEKGEVKSVRILTELEGLSCSDPKKFFGTVQDLTMLKEAQLALIESEEQFRSLAESSYDAITRYDKEFRYLYANKAVLQLTGFKLNEIIGKKNVELGMPKSVASYWEKGLQNVFKTGVFESQVFEWHSKGNTYTYDGRMFPEFDEKGDVKSVLCVSRDITEKKIVEKELEEYRIHLEKLVEQRTNELTEANKNLEIEMKKYEESEEKFRALAENAEDTIMRFDRTLKHMYVNPVVEKQTGINALEFIGKTHEELGFPEHLIQLWEKELVNVFKTGVSNRIEFMLPNGIWIDWSILPEFDDEGDVSSLVTVGRDITNRKNMEIKVEEALKKEKELNELKSKFISTTSHEFRTPLTAIMSSTELLERYGRKWDELKYEEHIRRILKSVEYLTTLMDDILVISRAESGKINYSPSEMNLRQLILDVLNDVSVLKTEKHKINFNYSIDEKIFLFDQKLLSMVFLNLLSNAFKYSPNGGNIDINIDKDDSIIFIEICDEGIGIPEKDLPMLFEAFHRAENVSELPGTGLGLSIVKTSIELHNGSISVETDEKVGTKFTIKLPIYV